jgi:hypothetical protein
MRRVFRRTAVPLASYYAVTLALPIANGAVGADAFLEHALVVLLVPLLIVLLASVTGWLVVSCCPRPGALPVRRATNLLLGRRAPGPARQR